MRRFHAALALIGLLALGSAAGAAGAAGTDDGRGGPRPSDMHFVQRATTGTLEARGGGHVLRLRRLSAGVSWFERALRGENRRISHARLVRKLNHQQLRDPRATLRVRLAGGERATVALRILDGRWNARQKSATYRVEPLRAGTLRRLPLRFGAATLAGSLQPIPARPPLGCQGNECLVRDIAELMEWTYNFFTARNTCTAAIANFSGKPLTWIGDDAKSEDSWQANPGRTLNSHVAALPQGHTFKGWTTVSAWLRGCWNNVRYSNQYGTVEVGVADPYSGGNDWLCRTTGELRCLGPDSKDGEWPAMFSRLGGKHLAVAYCIHRASERWPCDDDPWE